MGHQVNEEKQPAVEADDAVVEDGEEIQPLCSKSGLCLPKCNNIVCYSPIKEETHKKQ